jgi:hypothetical protein
MLTRSAPLVRTGNGSLMRLVPVVLAYAQQPLAAHEKAADSSRTTHGSPICVDACRYYAGLIVGTCADRLIVSLDSHPFLLGLAYHAPGALNGVGKDELLSSDIYSPVSGYFQELPLVPEVESVARGEYKSKQPPAIVGTLIRCTTTA